MTDELSIIESVVVTGDLSRLNPEQRVIYYRQVCQSLGLNPLTRPFDYITLNGKLTLYARKDAADQLRKIHSVSIGKPDIQFQDNLIIVTVEGEDKTGRRDAEVGVVNKGDMRGDVANAIMKAVTKAKRRLTLSLCGLGMLDETEVETIPGATLVDNGELLPAPTYTLTLEQAQAITGKDGKPYGEFTVEELSHHFNGIQMALKKNNLTPEKQDDLLMKLEACKVLIEHLRGG